MSEIKTDKLSPRTGAGTVTLGTSGDSYTIPAGVTLTNAGTLTNTGTLTNSGTASGFGKVLQFQTVSYKTFETTAGGGYGTWADTGFEGSITPTASDSKIIVTFYAAVSGQYQIPTLFFGIKRDGSLINIGNQWTTTNSLPARVQAGYSLVWSTSALDSVVLCAVDEPATTSSVTYKFAFQGNSSYSLSLNIAAQSVHHTPAVNYPSGSSTLTLMEIAG